jgi:hypothetical protein
MHVTSHYQDGSKIIGRARLDGQCGCCAVKIEWITFFENGNETFSTAAYASSMDGGW